MNQRDDRWSTSQATLRLYKNHGTDFSNAVNRKKVSQNALQSKIACSGRVEGPPKNIPLRSRRGFCTASLGAENMEEGINLRFDPKPIDAVCLRLGAGTTVQIAIGTIQRMAAIRAYNGYGVCGDWMEILSATYVVAIATRSADESLMQHIQNDLNQWLSIGCVNCRKASIGLPLIRERLFPHLKKLREHANEVLHHLDDPEQKGISELNIEGVYNYCYHLFQENNDALFGNIPDPRGKFAYTKCKKCRTAKGMRLHFDIRQRCFLRVAASSNNAFENGRSQASLRSVARAVQRGR